MWIVVRKRLECGWHDECTALLSCVMYTMVTNQQRAGSGQKVIYLCVYCERKTALSDNESRGDVLPLSVTHAIRTLNPLPDAFHLVPPVAIVFLLQMTEFGASVKLINFTRTTASEILTYMNTSTNQIRIRLFHFIIFLKLLQRSEGFVWKC